MKINFCNEITTYRVCSDVMWVCSDVESKGTSKSESSPENCACVRICHSTDTAIWLVSYISRYNHVVSCFHCYVNQMPLFCVVVQSMQTPEPTRPVKRYFLFFSGWKSQKKLSPGDYFPHNGVYAIDSENRLNIGQVTFGSILWNSDSIFSGIWMDRHLRRASSNEDGRPCFCCSTTQP